MFANCFLPEVEEARGSAAHATGKANAKLVDTKLEMVRAGWLFHPHVALPRVRWIDTPDRLQRDEIDGRLQGRASPREDEPCRDRCLGLACQRAIFHVGKYERQRRVG